MKPKLRLLSYICSLGALAGCSQQAQDFVRMARDKGSGLLPSLTYSAASGPVIESTNASNFSISGTCSANGQPVSITGSATASATCVNGSWTAIIDASAASDGILSLIAHHKDASGKEAPMVAITVPKDSAPPAYASFSKSAARATESNTSTSFTIQLSAAKPYDTVLNYTVSGSATTGVDHTLSAGSVTVPAGQTSANVSFDLINNGAPQSERRLTIGLSSSSQKNVLLSQVSTQTVDIADDDSGTYNTILSYAATSGSSCVLFGNNKLKCWGDNTFGQLGDGSTTDRPIPTAIDSTNSYTKVAMGRGPAMCAINTAGVLKCAGWNGAGQLGDGSTTQRLSLTTSQSGFTFSSISMGAGTHNCGITTGSKIRCWGSNAYGQIGDGSTTNRPAGVTVDSGGDYMKVATGEDATCAITLTGVLKCWGNNTTGQLGDGSTTQRLSPVVIDTGVTYASVAISRNSTCGVTTTGVLKCWGANTIGEVGDGTTTQRNSPVVIDSGTTYVSVSGSKTTSNTMCAITSTGILKCWGYNTTSLVGDGTTTHRTTPVSIDPGTTYASVNLGSNHACALTTDGILKCWGSGNSDSELQPYVVGYETLPVSVDAPIAYSQIAMAKGRICGILSNGKLKCWGVNSFGQLGDGTTNDHLTPVMVESLSSVQYSKISAGVSHTCALTTAGVAQCWGLNTSGQIGDGTTTTRLSPVVVDSGVTYSHLVAGDNSTCGITSAGVLKCWGSNSSGQLGDGTTTQRNSPVVIDSGVTYKSIGLGGTHACGVTTAGILKCWGFNWKGQVGDGTTTTRLSPVVIDSGVTYKVAVASSLGLLGGSCAITTADVLKCWGDNSSNQVGDGTATQRNTPVVINSGTTYSSVSSTLYSVCGITTAGVLKCWGSNWKGQAGVGSTSVVTTPTTVTAGTIYSAVQSHGDATCALTTAGALKCWGDNTESLLVRGDRTTGPSPIFRILEP